MNDIVCPLCGEYSSKHVLRVERHVINAHGRTLKEVHDSLHGGPTLCRCGCGERTTWLGWKRGYRSVVLGHNGRIDACYDEATAAAIKKKKNSALKGKSGWAKGLTKNTDERIKKRTMKRTPSMPVTAPQTMNLTQTDVPNVVTCSTCNWSSKASADLVALDRCPACRETKVELIDFIKSMNFNVFSNVIGIVQGHTVDVLVPEHMFAIEFNGLYWHSEAFKSALYHVEKTRAYEKLGISLMHVYEDEWMTKRPIIESIIRKRLGIGFERIDVGSCTIATLTKEDAATFFGRNHLDGFAGEEAICLIDRGRTVYAAAIAKKDGTIKIERCCSAGEVDVPNGLRTIVERIRSDRVTIDVDDRLGSTNNGIRNAGFERLTTSEPKKWWTDYVSRVELSTFDRESAGDAGFRLIHGGTTTTYELLR